MNFCDAHFHLIPSVEALGTDSLPRGRGVTAAHSPEEFLAQEKLVRQLNDGTAQSGAAQFSACEKSSDTAPASQACVQSCLPRVLQSFGMHPQAPFDGEADFAARLEFLEGLLHEGRIQAIGECGYDFFTPEFSANRAAQKKAFAAQLEAAAHYSVPVIVHARKAMQEIFEEAAALKKVPAVVFHSFAGTLMDALSLLDKGVNAYFSFGKPLMNGAKKAIRCARALPLERLLLETDAPYQTLKGELATSPQEIADVYQAAFEIRAAGSPFEARPSFFDFTAAIEKNFDKAFGLS